MVIKYNDLYYQHELIKHTTLNRIVQLFKDCDFINGKDVIKFEDHFAKYIGTKYAIGTSNGTDAIELCVRALNIVQPQTNLYIIPNNTFIATALGIQAAKPNAQIIGVDCDEYYQIDIKEIEKVLIKNKENINHCVIVGVHLHGHCCNAEEIKILCEQYNCTFLEDASQAHGAFSHLGKIGTLGKLSAFSLYPGKNLGAAGDAGIITTNDDQLAEIITKLRNFGAKSKYEYKYSGGVNHRLDSIQAIILDEKLLYLDKFNETRNTIAKYYNENINNQFIILPKTAHYCRYNVFHTYPIRTKHRYSLQEYLTKNGIETLIHYPKSLSEIEGLNIYNFSDTNSVQYSKELLSLPIHPNLNLEEYKYITDKLNEFTPNRI
jgi:dTDP-4-amino-4,6-dideoxygalactose transaminase